MMWLPNLVLAVVLAFLPSNAIGGRCPGEEIIEYYNVGIDLEKFQGDCDSDDMYEMGKIIQDVVKEVDRQVPEHKADKMRTMMCAVPEAHDLVEEAGDDEGSTRFLRIVNAFHRRLGLYTYRGGGYCRRCRLDNKDRRLGEEGIDHRDLTKDEYTSKAVCEMANTANSNKIKAETAAEHADEAIRTLREILQELKNESKRNFFLNKAESKLQKCKDKLESSLIAVESSMSYCMEAKKTNSEKEIEVYFGQSKRAVKYGDDAWNACQTAYETMHHYTIDAKRKINDQDYDLQMETIKAHNEEQKAAVATGIEKKMKELGEKAKAEKNDVIKEKYKKEIEVLNEEKREIEDSIRVADSKMVSEAKWAKDVTSLMLDVEAARDEKEWSRKFAKLVAEYVPQRLLQEYNSETTNGCLDNAFEPHVGVEVYLDLDEKEVMSQYDCIE